MTQQNDPLRKSYPFQTRESIQEAFEDGTIERHLQELEAKDPLGAAYMRRILDSIKDFIA